jgi:hypothetical protein
MTSRDYSEPLYSPREQSRTSRAEIRSRMRNRLGANRDSVPSTYRTLLAARDMNELVHLASNGRLRLQLVDEPTGLVISWSNALAEADQSDAS